MTVISPHRHFYEQEFETICRHLALRQTVTFLRKRYRCRKRISPYRRYIDAPLAVLLRCMLQFSLFFMPRVRLPLLIDNCCVSYIFSTGFLVTAREYTINYEFQIVLYTIY